MRFQYRILFFAILSSFSVASLTNAPTVNATSGEINAVVNMAIPAYDGKTPYGPITLELDTFSPSATGPSVILQTGATETAVVVPPKNGDTVVTMTANFGTTETPADQFMVCVVGHIDVSGCSQPIDYGPGGTGTIELTKANYDDIAAKANAEKTSCAINGVGWIVCPVVNFLASVADGAFKFLSDNFLNTNPDMFGGDSSSPAYSAWSSMRSIANVAFVIAFLIIIYSQLTSVGLTNYGVKKLLPRLVIAAILVNISYFICQIAVDLSNIIGFSLKDLIAGISVTSGSAQSGWTTGVGFVGIAGTVLAGAAITGIVWATLAALVPILLAAVVALIMILFILITRQALIILLVVISPLAFVCFLLPNTAQLFTKWRKAFTTMLLLFPIIALVFGMSTLASNILKATFTNTVAGTSGEFGQIIAAAVMILPLFVVPSLLKKSLDGVGSIGAKINAIGDKAGSALGKKGSEVYGNSRVAQYKDYRAEEKSRRRALIQSGQYEGSGGFLWNRRIGNAINSRINANTGGFGRRSAAKGVKAASKISEEAFSEAETLLRAEGTPESLVGGPGEQGRAEQAFIQAVGRGDTAGARAAQKVLLEGGDVGKDKLQNALRGLTANAGQGLRADNNRGLLSSIKRDLGSANLKGSNNALATFSYTDATPDHPETGSLGHIENLGGTYSGLSDEQLAKQSPVNLRRARDARAADGTPAISGEKAYNIINNPNIFKDLSEESKGILIPIASTYHPPPP